MHVNFDKYSSKRHPNFAAISFVGVFFLVLFYVYLPMLGGGPVLDDLKQYHGVQKFQTIWECFGRDIHGWFRPFKNLAFYCTLSAVGSFVYTKLACFAIFTANLLLLRKLFSLLGFSFYWAWGGAMVWALNPTMVSTVQFMSASNNQLCLSFLLLYLIAGLHYCDPGSPSKSLRARASFGAAILFLGLSMFSYEAGVSAPGILLVLVLLQYGWRGLFRSRAVMLVSASILTLAAYLIMRKLTGADTTFVSPNIPVGVEKLDLILRAPYYLWQHLLLWSSPWGRGGALIDHDPRGSVVLGVIGWLLILILLPGLLALISTRWRGVSAAL